MENMRLATIFQGHISVPVIVAGLGSVLTALVS